MQTSVSFGWITIALTCICMTPTILIGGPIQIASAVGIVLWCTFLIQIDIEDISGIDWLSQPKVVDQWLGLVKSFQSKQGRHLNHENKLNLGQIDWVRLTGSDWLGQIDWVRLTGSDWPSRLLESNLCWILPIKLPQPRLTGDIEKETKKFEDSWFNFKVLVGMFLSLGTLGSGDVEKRESEKSDESWKN